MVMDVLIYFVWHVTHGLIFAIHRIKNCFDYFWPVNWTEKNTSSKDDLSFEPLQQYGVDWKVTIWKNTKIREESSIFPPWSWTLFMACKSPFRDAQNYPKLFCWSYIPEYSCKSPVRLYIYILYSWLHISPVDSWILRLPKVPDRMSRISMNIPWNMTMYRWYPMVMTHVANWNIYN